jgi:eukaryotic-like serine/threonine-protein kinase
MNQRHQRQSEWFAPRPARATVAARERIRLTAPLDYHVFQRRNLREGVVRVAGEGTIACDRLEARLTGRAFDSTTLAGRWEEVPFKASTQRFSTLLLIPAGGWYAFEIRAWRGNKMIASRKIPHVGVGEVFVGAGQSNSTSCGGLGSKSRLDGCTRPKSGRVAAFDGTRWRVANDPQPGAHDIHRAGSFWPSFGDAMVSRCNVPVGVAVTGHSGTSIRQWTRRDELFHWTLARLRRLGPGGFRALLWYQGENDANTRMSARVYAAALAGVIRDWRVELGRNFPVFVAQASYIPSPKPRVSPSIRAAQRQLWRRKIAMVGPDTDKMVGDLRDMNGLGIHFSKQGLKVHGEAWAQKVGVWLDGVLNQTPQTSQEAQCKQDSCSLV